MHALRNRLTPHSKHLLLQSGLIFFEGINILKKEDIKHQNKVHLCCQYRIQLIRFVSEEWLECGAQVWPYQRCKKWEKSTAGFSAPRPQHHTKTPPPPIPHAGLQRAGWGGSGGNHVLHDGETIDVNEAALGPSAVSPFHDVHSCTYSRRGQRSRQNEAQRGEEQTSHYHKLCVASFSCFCPSERHKQQTAPCCCHHAGADPDQPKQSCSSQPLM